MRLGVYVYAIGTIAAGVLDLLWAEFDPGHQPIRAWGDYIPGERAFVYLAAVSLIVGGVAILSRRSARWGALVLTITYSIFGLFWFPRLYTAPHLLGLHINVYSAVLVGVGQQLILVAAALMIYATTETRDRAVLSAVIRWMFGLSAFDFGLAHLTGIEDVAPLVPKWIPLGGDFWTVLTGIAFVLAGLGILSGILDILAARLLALMLLVFSALALAPDVIASPHSHLAWGGNAYNLAAVGAAWILAEFITSRKAYRAYGRAPVLPIS